MILCIILSMGRVYKNGKKVFSSRKNQKLENGYQREVAHFLDYQTDLVWFHYSPNAYRAKLYKYAPRHISIQAGAEAKRRGVKKGISDNMIFTTPPNMPDKKGICIELKIGKNSLSPEQKQWKEIFEGCGFLYYVARDELSAVKDILLECGYDFEGKELFKRLSQV